MADHRNPPWSDTHDYDILQRLEALEAQVSSVLHRTQRLHQFLRVRPAGAAAISECMAIVAPLARAVSCLAELHQALYDAMPEGPWIKK